MKARLVLEGPDLISFLVVVSNSCNCVLHPRGGGGGNDIPCSRVPAARIFKELPCFGVKFSNIHPASESGFLPGIFLGGSIVMLCKFPLLS